MHDIVVSIKELLSDPLVFSVVMTVLVPVVLPRLAKALDTISNVILQRKAALTAAQITLVNTLATTAVLAVEKQWQSKPHDGSINRDADRLNAAVVYLNALLAPYKIVIDAKYAQAVIHAALLLAEVNGQLPAAPEQAA